MDHIESKADQIFRSGFEHARADYARGIAVADIIAGLNVAQNYHLIEGALAFCTMRQPTAGARYVERAVTLGLSP